MVEIKQQDQVSTNFKEMIQRAINAKVKVGLKSSTMIWDLETWCPKSHRLSHNAFPKIQTQNSNNKDFYYSE